MPLTRAKELLSLIMDMQNNFQVDAATKLPPLPVNPYAKLPPDETSRSLEDNKTHHIIQASLCENLLTQRLSYVMECGASLPTYKNTDRLSAEITGNYCHSLI
jgi:hypothetical protein